MNILGKSTTILLPKEVKQELDSFKEYERETYSEVIRRLIARAMQDEEEKLELSEETLKGVKEAREDIKKGKVFTSKQIKDEMGF